ncbi:MAG: ATP-binding protein [Acidobacteriota bacterium]
MSALTDVEPLADATWRRSMEATTSELIGAGRALRDFLDGHDLGTRARYACELAFEELVSNVVHHAYDEGGPVEVTLVVDASTVTLTVIDSGRPFDPTAHQPPPAPADLDAAPIGGLGLTMVRRAVAAMRYARRDGINRTQVSLPTTD